MTVTASTTQMWIIPARAGFTRPRAATGRGDPDHPRSRGVYGCETLGDLAAYRIIPARAGFTPPSSPPLTGERDHPRSRGVYAGVADHVLGLEGIIPARAGFTWSGGRRRGRSSDHPRSRGVYEVTGPRGSRSPGSSPLARGLLPAAPGADTTKRIIPARAGFTPRRLGRGVREGDHPRSRGVYPGGDRGARFAAGSSPLARGLPCPRARLTRMLGIIPARAGFTAGRAAGPAGAADHPRSRGVYSGARPSRTHNGGSSPLARGLLAVRKSDHNPARIIPARAGFTPWGPVGGSCRSDHPRSRGVYPRPRSCAGCAPGSSPLARGLRAGPVCPGAGTGIIPARAGFTRTRELLLAVQQDHPRSRGVYTGYRSGAHLGEGSSPLARGLPSAPPRDRRASADHPRSRGVYPERVSYGGLAEGSSPLARGLQRESDSA